jgi:tetratricopeptide (TPR) repeat protein
MKFNKLFFIFLFFSATVFAQTDTSETIVVLGGQDGALAYNQGITDANKRDLDKSLENFSRALGYAPRYSKALYNRGIIYLEKQMNKEALQDLTDAVISDRAKPQYYLARAIAHARLKNFENAYKMVRKAELMDYNKSEIQYYYGYVYFMEERYALAEKSFTEAIKCNEKFAYAYCDRAAARFRQGNLKAALEDYTKALEIKPNAVFIYTLRSEVKAAQNNFNGAIEDINSAMEIDTENEVIYLNDRANMYVRAKKYKLAIKDFNTCIEKYPKNPDAYINYGNMLMEQKKYAEAEQYYTKAIEKDYNNIAAYNNRANAKELQFNLKGAEADKRVAKHLIEKQKQ